MNVQRASIIASTAALAVAELARIAIRLAQHRDGSAEFHCWVVYVAVGVCVYASLTRPDRGGVQVHNNTWHTAQPVGQQGDGPDPEGEGAGSV